MLNIYIGIEWVVCVHKYSMYICRNVFLRKGGTSLLEANLGKKSQNTLLGRWKNDSISVFFKENGWKYMFIPIISDLPKYWNIVRLRYQYTWEGRMYLEIADSENQLLKNFVSFFSKKSCNNVWSVNEKYLPLHPQSRGTPFEVVTRKSSLKSFSIQTSSTRSYLVMSSRDRVNWTNRQVFFK